MDPQDQLTEYLVHATHGVAFTGAGISTESGIADFRSPGGLWDRHKPVYYDEFVASRAARVRYWKTRIELYKEFANAEPNTGHHAIAQLEDMGKLAAVELPVSEEFEASDELEQCIAQLALAGKRDRVDFLIEKERLKSLSDTERSELRQLGQGSTIDG